MIVENERDEMEDNGEEASIPYIASATSSDIDASLSTFIQRHRDL
jgi:hypothetical protein